MSDLFNASMFLKQDFLLSNIKKTIFFQDSDHSVNLTNILAPSL